MTGLLDRIQEIRYKALEDLSRIASIDELERWRVEYLGKRGKVTEILRGLGALPPELRPAVGQAANQLREELERAYREREAQVKAMEVRRALEAERIDVTLPGRPQLLGRLHPTTIMIQQIVEVFVRLGYDVVEGPEVETDYYNFEALNIPKDHPARDMWDTIYVAPPEVLLRTHTSPMQARIMEKQGPPVRVVVPGRCYRYEAQDASHEWMFYQIEGLAVDKGITMADLKGTLTTFAQQIFGSAVRTRFTASYFPFTEPSAEMAISCPACGGRGEPECRVCRGGAWLEILGCGMVHPKVLAGVGYDPDRYTGFAFGMGVERIAMVKYGITDIRLFYSNDLRFLEQFA